MTDKPQLPVGLKLALDLGPLVLFFIATTRPALFAPLVAPFLSPELLAGPHAGIFTATVVFIPAVLMGELEKVVRVMKKVDATAPHAVLLVLDATVGQNALSQVEVFRRIAGVTGLAMTKLDGTARGGILVAIAAKFGLPVHFIGVGEGVEDLAPFAARDFARAIAGIDA